ncbi:MAG: hypothetical protein OCD01_19890 [Fibrobacterales bacterium]
MKYTIQRVFFALIAVTYLGAAPVEKTFTKPVFMHYMPWWDTPEFNNGNWGWHWTMNTKNPDTIIDEVTGRRDIAAHYYPLIGTYDSEDTVVIENHLLLMKYSGIDGVLINWYGETGNNGDVGELLKNSNAIVDMSQKLDMQFSVIMEDRFSSGLGDVKTNITYVKNNYFTKDNFITFFDDEPFFGIFGPITLLGESNWNQAMDGVGQETVFLTLPNKIGDVGAKGDGEYDWVFSGGVNDTRSFYENKAPGLFFAMGGAYPGFHDYYEEGGAQDSYFDIGKEDGGTLIKTLDLAIQHQNTIQALQLITWNDYGEGTMFEPTVEWGYTFLTITQDKLGVKYKQYELEQIHRLYILRKEHADNTGYQIELNAVRDHFVNLDVEAAVAGMDNLGQAVLSSEDISSDEIVSSSVSISSSSLDVELSSFDADIESVSSNSFSSESQSVEDGSSQLYSAIESVAPILRHNNLPLKVLSVNPNTLSVVVSGSVGWAVYTVYGEKVQGGVTSQEHPGVIQLSRSLSGGVYVVWIQQGIKAYRSMITIR